MTHRRIVLEILSLLIATVVIMTIPTYARDSLARPDEPLGLLVATATYQITLGLIWIGFNVIGLLHRNRIWFGGVILHLILPWFFDWLVWIGAIEITTGFGLISLGCFIACAHTRWCLWHAPTEDSLYGIDESSWFAAPGEDQP